MKKINAAEEVAQIPVYIWVATYPNDYSTLGALQSLNRRDTVNIVINPLNGPTTKSQNLVQALSSIADVKWKNTVKDRCYFLVLDAEVFPTKHYFETLKDALSFDPRVVYQTKVIAYPFKSRNLWEKIVGHMYFVSQSYMQWFIDSPRRDMDKE